MKNSIRHSSLKALLVISSIIVLITEVLSQFALLTRTALFLCYFTLIALSIVYLFRYHKLIVSRLKKILISISSPFEKIILIACGVILSITLLTSLISAPNNWDSMVYHLARIPYWIQQAHVGHYPAHVSSQLIMSPLSEFVMLHSMLLTDSDLWLNLFQWIAAAGAAIAASLISQYLSFSKKVQYSAALLTLCSPMLLMQSSSTQNDLIATFFLLCTLTFILKFRKDQTAENLLFIAVSAGLAILSKGTAYIFLFPMSIWTLFLIVRSKHKHWRTILLSLGVILILNMGHWNRNYKVFDSPLGMNATTLTYFHPKGIASNLIRNSLMECVTAYPSVNSFLGKTSYKLHQIIGIDQNDPRTTWSGSMSFEIRPLRLQEDYANNPVHFLLFFLALLYLIIRKEKSNLVYIYSLCAISGFILLSSLLEWQVWHNRLHLPFILMTVPISAYVLSKYRILQYTLLICLGLYAIYAAFNNESRMLYGEKAIWKKTRTEQYFTTRPGMLQDWERIHDKLRSVEGDELALIGSPAMWDYPTWFILNKDKRFHIQNIKVQNSSKVLEDARYNPDVILVNKVSTGEILNHNGRTYKRVIQTGELALYEVQN